MVKHNKNFKSKKKQSLKKKALRKTKRKGGKKSKKGGNDTFNRFVKWKNEVRKNMTKNMEWKESTSLSDFVSDLFGSFFGAPLAVILFSIYVLLVIVGSLGIALKVVSENFTTEELDAYGQRTGNRIMGGSIFRDGKALTHVSNKLCEDVDNDNVFTHKSRARGMLETHDEIYVCNNKDGKIKILESIARTRINRYISRKGLKQGLGYSRKFHLLKIIHNLPNTYADLNAMINTETNANTLNDKTREKIETYKKQMDSVIEKTPEINEIYENVVTAIKDAVKYYCKKTQDSNLKNVCDSFTNDEKYKKLDDNENKNIREGLKTLINPTIKEMVTYVRKLDDEGTLKNDETQTNTDTAINPMHNNMHNNAQ
jgi:hypothetical protein